MTATSFYAPAPAPEKAEDAFLAYMDYLKARNGDPNTFEDREKRMANVFDNSPVRGKLDIDVARFNRNYTNFKETDITDEEKAVLAFVKINAGEAYGVEVTSKARAHLWELPDTMYKVEKIVGREEDYHTRLLLGATQHFEGLTVTEAFRPTWPMRLTIGILARLPQSMFHPVLLGAEVSGLYVFNWLLNRLGTLFKDMPDVRDSMEERLLEILVDEIGHVAFNRILVGKTGRKVAAGVARKIVDSHRVMSKELIALGLDANAIREVEEFDYLDLPESVRKQAFFV